MLADLLSDTLTAPTPAMREAMAHAVVGDDVFGEDPTVAGARGARRRPARPRGRAVLADRVAGQPARHAAARRAPAQELVADQQAHVLRAEMGAGAVFSGITSRSWPSERGLLDPAGPMSLVTTGVGPYQVETALVVLENTHNFGGGTVQPIEAIREVRAATQAVGVAMHLDGARLWNAHVASGVSLRDYGTQFDTVSVCLSKGLGAPVGSVLVGSADADGRGPDLAQALRRRHAPGRHPRRRRPVRPRPPHRTARRRPRPRGPLRRGVRAGGTGSRRRRPPSRPTSSCSTSAQSVGPHRSSSPRCSSRACAPMPSGRAGCAPCGTSTSTTPAPTQRWMPRPALLRSRAA